MMVKRFSFGVVVAVLLVAFAATGTASATVILSEGFESYANGSYPSPTWQNVFSGASGYVTNAAYHNGAQSFRSESYPNWARWDVTQLASIPDMLTYRFAILLTEAGKGGSVGFGFVQPGTSNLGWKGNAVDFANNGNVYFYTRTAGNTMVGTWSPNVWYEVEVRLDYATHTADVYIGGAQVANDLPTDPKVLPASLYGVPIPLDKFGMFGWNFGGPFATSVVYYDDLSITAPLEVAFDVKPGSCPNPLNLKWAYNQFNRTMKGGVLPVAILGTADLDVSEIDVSTVLLEGVAPLRWSYDDVATPADGMLCECGEGGPDGNTDLTLKFDKLLVAEALGTVSDGDVVVLMVTGYLLDGTKFLGKDCVVIGAKGYSPFSMVSPDRVMMGDASPNPFNPTTWIHYSLPSETFVDLSVYDVAGKRVGRLVAQTQQAGEHVAEWNASGMPSGVYFFRLNAGSFAETRKVILLK